MSCKGDTWVVTAIGGVVSGAYKNPSCVRTNVLYVIQEQI
jgi:hypothetical protein